MSTTLEVTIGYGFKLPQVAIDAIHEKSDSVYEYLEEVLGETDLLECDMAYYRDDHDEEPYAILVKRLSDRYYGAHVHVGPPHSVSNDLTDSEVSALVTLFKRIGLKPDLLDLHWLTVVSLG